MECLAGINVKYVANMVFTIMSRHFSNESSNYCIINFNFLYTLIHFLRTVDKKSITCQIMDECIVMKIKKFSPCKLKKASMYSNEA